MILLVNWRRREEPSEQTSDVETDTMLSPDHRSSDIPSSEDSSVEKPHQESEPSHMNGGGTPACDESPNFEDDHQGTSIEAHE